MGVRNNFVTLLQIDLYNNRENSKAETKQEKKSTNKKRRKTKQNKTWKMHFFMHWSQNKFSSITVTRKTHWSRAHIRPRLWSTHNPIKFGMRSHQLITVSDCNWTRTTTWNLPGPSGALDCINSSAILLGSRARLDRLVARFFLRWYKVSFDKCSLWFSINFTMESSLNVDSFDKSLLFSISFTMEGSLLSDHS